MKPATAFIDPPAPGSRVRIRGEDWAVEKCLPLAMGGHAIHVQGVSELVRHHQAIFLTPLEREIVPLRAEDTKLVVDTSPEYRQTALFLETLLRRTPPTHDKIAIGHKGALDVMPYQLVPAQKSLAALRPRILVADGTGLGKTVELGLILTELIKRGRGRRILVVAIRSMLAQLQRELWARFTLPLVRLDSEGLARVQAKIPANRNPFSHFDRVIVSMDTLKNSGLYRAWLEQIRWDVIVVDECHNVANKGSQRGELARLLAAQCDALVLTSATPHNGRPESFANLMRMLDPTSIADPRSFTKEDVEHLFVRRFKKDVEKEAGGQLQDRAVDTLSVVASPEDEAALAALHALSLSALGRRASRKDPLVKWTLVKAFLSSPEACLESLDNRMKVTHAALEGGDGPHPSAGTLRGDLETLLGVRALVEAAHKKSGKLARLVARLKAIGVASKKGGARVVLFSERLRTLYLLRDTLPAALGLSEDNIGVFTADAGSDISQRELVERFGHEDSPLRVLLCSDAASEGVNLHHQCNHLIHVDVPWSLIRLTQRNGRIDRFGQKKVPHLEYLVLHTAARTADQHVTDRLIAKEKEVERQLGDPGALLGLYDVESEEEFLTRGVAEGRPVDALIPDAPLAAGVAEGELASSASEEAAPAAPSTAAAEPAGAEPEIDLLALLAAVEAEQARTPGLDTLVAEAPTLFPSDYAFLVATLRHLADHPVVGSEPLKWDSSDKDAAVTIHAPEPFRRHREPFLPREGVPPTGEPYRLVMGRDLVATKLRAALDAEGRWPDWHLLWEQHPLVDWLLDALGSAYARGDAPLVRIQALGKAQVIFLLQGMLFNHESEAVEARWMGLSVDVTSAGVAIATDTLSLDDVVQRVGLREGMVNPGKPSSRLAVLQKHVPAVVAEARTRLERDRKEHMKTAVSKRARTETRRLNDWAERSLAVIDAQASAWSKRSARIPRHVEERMGRERQAVELARRNHEQLLKSLQSLGAPHIRVAAVFSGE